jgi:predicted MFS family arabinose efflux permease
VPRPPATEEIAVHVRGAATTVTRPALSEPKLLWLLGAIQFVNVLDFMMIMPLGPDLSGDLGIPTSLLGLLGGSYTAAAAVSGVVASLFLDRFDRKKALLVALAGLVVGTAAGGFATGLYSLLAARVVAGAFGGPATSLSLSIIADVIPVERRGRAMGAVMGAFSVASVLGVPAGLELSRLGGWPTPFFAVALAGALVTALALALMPPLTGHLGARQQGRMGELLGRREVWYSLGGSFVAMMGNFAIIPNLSAYWQFNLRYPRERLGLLYLVGGIVTFGTMRLSGLLVDRIGPSRVALAGTALFVLTLVVGFIYPVEWVPVMVIFVTFMAFGTFRIIPMQALSSRVPRPHERARFMSAQSAVQHSASAAGSMLASLMLTEQAGGKLAGMNHVAWLTAALAVLLPFLLYLTEIRVQHEERTT